MLLPGLLSVQRREKKRGFFPSTSALERRRQAKEDFQLPNPELVVRKEPTHLSHGRDCQEGNPPSGVPTKSDKNQITRVKSSPPVAPVWTPQIHIKLGNRACQGKTKQKRVRDKIVSVNGPVCPAAAFAPASLALVPSPYLGIPSWVLLGFKLGILGSTR